MNLQKDKALFLASLAAWLIGLGGPGFAQDAPAVTFFVKPAPENDSVAIWMRNSVIVRAGSYCLFLDPGLLVLQETALGSMFNLLPVDAVVIKDSIVYNERGALVEGGLMFVWINSLININQAVIPAGEHETLVLRFDKAASRAFEGKCATIHFLEALRADSKSIPVHNEVAQDGLIDFRAVTEDHRICFGAPAGGGLQLPGDCTQDGALDLSDAVCMLILLFWGDQGALPCSGATVLDDGNRHLLNFDGNAEVDLTDAIAMLLHQFSGGAGHVLGSGCVKLVSCPDVCVPAK